MQRGASRRLARDTDFALLQRVHREAPDLTMSLLCISAKYSPEEVSHFLRAG